MRNVKYCTVSVLSFQLMVSAEYVLATKVCRFRYTS